MNGDSKRNKHFNQILFTRKIRMKHTHTHIIIWNMCIVNQMHDAKRKERVREQRIQSARLAIGKSMCLYVI